MNNQKKKRINQRPIAWSFLIIFCCSLFSSSIAFAGGGGPTQPEVQGFTPIGVSDMVDPFTGDFTYNIPLMDVDGYPINIAYSSGISMDQESSWVGLGWNLSSGAIVRNMRGLPDDFKGDTIEKNIHQKTQVDIQFGGGVNGEFFGKELKIDLGNNNDTTITNYLGKINVSATLNYSNYTGWGFGFDLGPSFSFMRKNKIYGGFSLSGSSENGAGFAPDLSLSTLVSYEKLKNGRLNNTLGASFNSRAGLSQISFQQGINGSVEKTDRNNIKTSHKASFSGVSGSYNVGLRHYSPSSQPGYYSRSFSGRFTTGQSFFGADGQITISFNANYSKIDPFFEHQVSPAFGYFNLQSGQRNPNALLDFNRDNDGSFTQNTPMLPSAFLTSDLFSIQAQGISGSYRAYRNEVGFVFDPVSRVSSNTKSVGIEFGLGGTSDLGIDISGTVVNSYAGVWDGSSNNMDEVLSFESTNEILEPYAMQEANEKSVDTDDLFGVQFAKDHAQKINLAGPDVRPVLTSTVENSNVSGNNRDSRIKRNQVVSILTISEVNNGMGISYPNPLLYSGAKAHHIGEITQLGTDGRRYVFGLPAYTKMQEDFTFAVGNNLSGNKGIHVDDDYNGLIDLGNDFTELASDNNRNGIDQYYMSEKKPGYAHSFMLTSVLSDDYVDSDDIKGPSENDLGSYVKFDYDKVNDFHWRSPMNLNSAYHNPGLLTDDKDDKASVVYGEKELWYMKKIETKNYVAIFWCEDRNDGASVTDRKGGLSASGGKMKCLKKISLYTKADYYAHLATNDLQNANAIQEVHFVYDYSLCPGYVGNLTGGGKLTLKEIYFTYQGSFKMKRSSYKFQYNSPNAGYNMKSVDRWGNFKATGAGNFNALSVSSLTPLAYDPYTPQDSTVAGLNAQQWCLTDIILPSGGKIKVDYESDDYQYVQNVRASQMFPIVSTGDDNDGMNLTNSSMLESPQRQPISTDSKKNKVIFIKMKPGYTDVSKYAQVGQLLYFKILVNIGKRETNSDPARFEYVSGYAKVESIVADGQYARIRFSPTKLLDNGNNDYSPLTKSAIQFARMNLSRTINDIGNTNTADEGIQENGILDLFGSIASSITSLGELVTGPNKAIYDKEKCQEIITQRSFVKLFEPTGHKMGGGLRVKQITMYDNWNEMVRNNDPNRDYSYSYGQKFTYKLEDGTSSGVATYEPVIGGDENSLVTAVTFKDEIKLAPDYEMYKELPLMESQFPNPSVGYSRVIVEDLPRAGVIRTATGKVVKEFYTAKDFPVITQKTDVDPKVKTSFLPFSPKYEYLTASQGFYIETNDMHGKPKSEAIYANDKTDPISTVNYDYLQQPTVVNGLPAFKLLNDVQVINEDGTTNTAEIGVKYEAVGDFRENKTTSVGVGPIQLNTNSFLAGPLFLVIPTIWGKIDLSQNRFRSATLNKTVTKFGIQSTTRADQDGSKVETNNLAYDAETGDVLATQTTTNYNDKVYSLNFPAYWKNENMGLAYKNIGYTITGYPIGADGFVPVPQQLNYFIEGDELIVTPSEVNTVPVKAWVVEVNTSGIRIQDKFGSVVISNSASLKIIRSGRKNKQTASMASLVSLENPIPGLVTETYAKVLNAGAVQFSENWGTFCNCFDERYTGVVTKNPYVLGTKGNSRPIKSFTYLTNRTQTFVDNNTDIRRDGVFESFSPYFYYLNNEWRTNGSNWTFVSEVTQFSPNGMTMETKDALNRYSASLFSFNNTLTTAVAANAKLGQIAEGSFEDVGSTSCADQGVFSAINPTNISTSQAHTGRNSLHLTAGNTIGIGQAEAHCSVTNDCSLSLTAISSNSYSVSGTVDQFNQKVISGEGSASLTGNTVSISYTAGTYFEIILDITDNSSNCSIKVRISSTPPGNNQLNMEIISVDSN